MSSTVRIVFSGEFLPGHDPETVKRAVIALLKPQPEHEAMLFSGQKIILRKGLQEADAPRYVERLSRTGIRVHIQPEDAPLAPPPPVQPAPISAPVAAAMHSVEPTIVVSPKRAPEPAPAIPPADPARWAETTMLVTAENAPPGLGDLHAAHAGDATVIMPAPQRPAPVPPPMPAPTPTADATIIVSPSRAAPPPIPAAPPAPAPQSAMLSTDATVVISRETLKARGLIPNDIVTQMADMTEAGGEARVPDAAVLGFSFKGRLGRLAYLAGSFLLSAIMLTLLAVIGKVATLLMPSPIAWGVLGVGGLVTLLFVPIGLRLTALRFHDVGASGWLCLLMLIPYVGGLVNLVLLFVPGNANANAYGAKPRTAGTPLVVGALCAIIGAGIVMGLVAVDLVRNFSHLGG